MRRTLLRIAALVLAPLQILAAQVLVPPRSDIQFAAVAVERVRLRRIAARLGIGQRALIFALTAFALNENGRAWGRRGISTIYADMDPATGVQNNDAFFQFHMIGTRLKWHDEFATFAREVDATISAADTSKGTGTQMFLGAMFRAHRIWKRFAPFLYSERLFRYAAGYQLDLSLIPPVRPQGALGEGVMEPIHVGTHHPGINMCIFAPSRRYVTFNCAVRARHLPQVHRIASLVDELDRES